MKVIYAQQPLPKSIFLGGPSPRPWKPGGPVVASWRPRACVILEKLKFDGTVLVPELDGVLPDDNKDAQVHWEWEGLNQATIVVFWVPRDLTRVPGLEDGKLPGFTTNVEFGMLVASGKVVFGYPEGAPKMRYLEMLAERYGITVYGTLQETLEEAVRRTKLPFGAR